MVKIAGSKKLKRQMAPLFWGITRKDKRFVVTARPGPHGKNSSVPSAVFLRDMIKIVNNLREAKFAIYKCKVMVDGVKRKSLHHGIGLMDVIQLEGVKEIYRLVPMDGILLKQILMELVIALMQLMLLTILVYLPNQIIIVKKILKKDKKIDLK